MTTAAQLTPGQARIIDPVLSQHARGYRQAALIASSLFPSAPVQMYGGQVIQFDKSAFRLVNSKRAPGTATKRLQFGYLGERFAIVPNSLEATVPREIMRDASQVPGINLATRAVNTVLRTMLLNHEMDCATIARNSANYDANHTMALSGTSLWSNSASTPSENIESAREAIRESVGVYPNTCMLSAKAMKNLKFHPEIIDRLKYTSIKSVTTDLLSTLWEIPTVVVGAGVYADPQTDAFGDVWGPDVILAYVAPDAGGDAGANAEEPSYGYSYQIEGMPMVEETYWDQGFKSWIYPVTNDQTPVLSGMQAGFLIAGAGN